MNLGSAEGLEGLTIGRLARELQMSKSGLFAHFGSKEELQLAAVDVARAIFVDKVMERALAAPPGIARLRAMLEAWVAYVERSVFKGGCFFAAASAECDGRPGRVRDEVARLTRSWLDALEAEIRQARSLLQLRSRINPEQLAFEVHALVQEANWAYQLLREKRVFERAREGIRHRLERAATRRGLRQLRDRRTASRTARNARGR